MLGGGPAAAAVAVPGYPPGMTPEKFLNLTKLKMLYATIGPIGVVLALAGFFGVRWAGDEWAHSAGDVLGAAMTPVAVLAAAAVVLCHAGVVAAEANPKRRPGANDVIANMAAGYGVATAYYFGFALAALSFKDQGPANTFATAMAFAWLGLVLGSSVMLIWRLGTLWTKPQTQDEAAAAAAPDSQ